MKILDKMKWGFLLLGVLVSSGVSAQFASTSVRDRIYMAASAGNVWELKRLESLGYSLEMADVNGNTAYCQAVWSQNRTAVSTLIAAGVDVRPRCLRRIPYVTETRIYAAAHAEDLNQLVAWKKEGLNVDVVNPRTGNSALCEAVYNYDCPAIQTLLRAGSEQAQPCMRRVPQYVRDKLQCRPLKIDWSIVGYSVLGAGMAGALVAVLASGGSKGDPTCTAQQRWIGDRCQSCETCWIGTTCISLQEMNDAKRPYYRDEKTASCWQVSPPPVEMTKEEFDAKVEEISTEGNGHGVVPYQKGNYQPMINAAAAYARGYTGYMVERTSPYGRPSNGTLNTPSISKKKVTVAVYSSGMTIGQGGKVTNTSTSTTENTDELKNGTAIWDWNHVNHAFYNDEDMKKNVSYKPTGGSSTTADVTSDFVVETDKLDTNLALNSSGTPYGYNFDYGPCGETKKNCYGSIEKTVGSTKYNLAVLYGSSETSYSYVIMDKDTGVLNGYTTTDPTSTTIGQYVDSTSFNTAYFGFLQYDADYVWTNVKGTSYDADPTPHYQIKSDAAYSSLDPIIGSKGTFLAGIVAAMKQIPPTDDDDVAQTYGVAYNAAILPVNRDVAYGISAEAMKVMTTGANIVLLDEGYTTTYGTTADPTKVVNDALAAFTYDSTTQTYTARQMNELFGSDKANAYTYLKQNDAVAVVANGNGQDTYYHLMQPALQSAIPLMSGFNDINYNETTWKKGNMLPSVNENNPLYRLYLTVGAVQEKSVGGNTYYNLEGYSQPCGIAGSYCLVAPGGNSLVAGKEIYSTTDLVKSGAGESATYSYASSYGTSSAAAVVAGSLAVLMGAYPHLTTQQAVEILLKTATYLDLDDISDADQTTDGKKVKDVYKTYFGANSYVGYDEKLDHYYNAVFGYGLVNLDAATDPIGGKNGLWVYKSGTAVGSSAGVIQASATAMMSPASLSGLSGSLTSSLPANFVAFDAYNRPFLYPTAELFQLQNRRKAKTWNDFKMFMNGWDPVVTQPSENFSMTYRSPTNRVVSSSQIPLGLMQATLKQNKMKYTLFYSQDTTQGTGAYWQRRQSNPFIQMKDAYGLSSSYQFNPKWSVEVGWTMGRNGFFDEDDRHFDAPDNKMQALSTSVVFKPMKKISLKVASGIMKENGSSLGMVSSGAFNIQGASTQYVGGGIEFSPIDKVHLEAMYYYGQTKTTSKGGLMNLSRLASDSFALTASYEPTENQLFGFQISSPLRIRKGAMNVSLPVGRHATEDIYYYQDYSVNMKPKARELDLSMYYQGNVSDEVSLQGELGVRLNPDHQADVAPDYRGMVGVKWKY